MRAAFIHRNRDEGQRAKLIGNWVLSVVLSIGATLLIKRQVQRPRPTSGNLLYGSGPDVHSFPSGHALSSFIFFSVLIYISFNANLKPALRWVLAIFFFVFAIAIALSRIILKVHYPTDVIASFCLGTVWVTLSFWILKKINRAKGINATLQ